MLRLGKLPAAPMPCCRCLSRHVGKLAPKLALDSDGAAQCRKVPCGQRPRIPLCYNSTVLHGFDWGWRRVSEQATIYQLLGNLARLIRHVRRHRQLVMHDIRYPRLSHNLFCKSQVPRAGQRSEGGWEDKIHSRVPGNFPTNRPPRPTEEVSEMLDPPFLSTYLLTSGNVPCLR